MKPRVLVVDDEETIRKLLKSRLERDGLEVTTVSNAEEAEAQISKGGGIGVMVTDLKMPGKDGLQLTTWAKEKLPSLRVIVITGHGEKDVAVQALKRGASDYLEKPFDMDEISHAVRRCLHEYMLERENQDLVSRLEARVQRVEGKVEDQVWYVSKSSSMSKVNEWLSILRREAMRGDAEEPSVLITGESGTGKEGIARMIHAGSRRGKGPWVAVNCANFSEQLLESELFGHEKGAFTGANALKRGLFEIAKSGLTLLDEIGEMDVKLQAKLLRVLQERTFRRVGGTVDLETDVRIIAATNRNLTSRVESGAFRDDLYHRICRVVVELPSLRDRTDDVVPMATQFGEKAFRARGKTFEGFTPEAEDALRTYTWPGNVRELLNFVERTALIWQGTGPVTPKALALPERARPLELVTSPLQSSEISDVDAFYAIKKRWLDAFEREFIITAVNKAGGNISEAARSIKMDRSNLMRLMKRHGINSEEYRKAA